MPGSLRISFAHNRDGSGTRPRIWGKTEKNIINLAGFGLSIRDQPGESSWSFEGREVPEDSSSALCFQLASEWLQDCMHNHSICRESWKQSRRNAGGSSHNSGSSFCPTRLLDIGPTDGSVLCLLDMNVQEDKSSTPIAWVALSHRWGSVSPMTTTTKNLQQMQQGIPLASLPKTFLDAVIITRKMGQRYLWIDSLCIIQDSKEDWTAEAATMGEIYSQSVLAIASHNAPDCHSGILTPRIHDQIIIHDSAAHSTTGFSGTTRTTGFSRTTRRFSDSQISLRHDLLPWNRSVDGPESSLSSRGWILQESVLSPRALLYCKDQMFWECRSVTLAEGSRRPLHILKRGQDSGDKHVPDLVIRDLLEHTQPGYSRRSLDLQDISVSAPGTHVKPDESALWTNKKSFMSVHNLSPLQICRSWQILVEDYSSRQLTQQDDRVQAIAGLAAHFETRLGCCYVAGVFQCQPHSTLLWRIYGRGSQYTDIVVPGHSLARPSHTRAYHRAPSWSWLSVEGPVIFDSAGFSAQEPPYKPYTAQIMLPTITQKDEDFAVPPSLNILEVNGLWRHSLEYTGAQRCQEILILDGGGFRGRAAICKFDFLDEQDIWSRALHRTFGILIITSSGNHENFGDDTLYGLLLEPTDGSSSSGTYRRIGIATVEPYWRDIDEKTRAGGGHDRLQWIEATFLIS